MNQRKDDLHIQRVALYAILANVALAALRGWLAYLSGSLAVVAVTIDAAIDVAAALLLWAGLKLSVRKTRSFPYGLYKLENVVQVVVAILIFLVGYEIVRHALASSGSSSTPPVVVLVGMGFSTVAVLGLSLYMAREGRKTASPGLLAEARHRWVDLAASAIVFVALLSGGRRSRGTAAHGKQADRSGEVEGHPRGRVADPGQDRRCHPERAFGQRAGIRSARRGHSRGSVERHHARRSRRPAWQGRLAFRVAGHEQRSCQYFEINVRLLLS